MKKTIIKYRGIIVISISLIFNLISSLLVWHPEGVSFNRRPMTVAEWICDIIATIILLIGFVMMLYDVGRNQREQIEQGCENGVNKFRELIKEIDGQDKDNL